MRCKRELFINIHVLAITVSLYDLDFTSKELAQKKIVIYMTKNYSCFKTYFDVIFLFYRKGVTGC